MPLFSQREGPVMNKITKWSCLQERGGPQRRNIIIEYQSSNTNTSLYVHEIHHNCFNSNLRNIRYSHTITCDVKKADFWILSHPKSDDSCPQEVFDFGVTSLCMFLKKCDFD